MSENLGVHYIYMMQAYAHRMVVGPAFTEFEHLCYEQLCRATASMAEYNRICVDDAIRKANEQLEKRND